MKLLSLFALALAATAHAEDWTLTNGKTYKGVVVTKKTPTTVSFTHESGVAQADFMEIPESQRAALGFSAEAYRDAKNERARAQADAAKKQADLAKAVVIVGEVLQNVDEGILTSRANMRDGFYLQADIKGYKGKSLAGDFLLTGHPQAATLTDGTKLAVSAIEEGVFKYEDTSGAERTVKKFRVVAVHGTKTNLIPIRPLR